MVQVVLSDNRGRHTDVDSPEFWCFRFKILQITSKTSDTEKSQDSRTLRAHLTNDPLANLSTTAAVWTEHQSGCMCEKLQVLFLQPSFWYLAFLCISVPRFIILNDKNDLLSVAMFSWYTTPSWLHPVCSTSLVVHLALVSLLLHHPRPVLWFWLFHPGFHASHHVSSGLICLPLSLLPHLPLLLSQRCEQRCPGFWPLNKRLPYGVVFALRGVFSHSSVSQPCLEDHTSVCMPVCVCVCVWKCSVALYAF